MCQRAHGGKKISCCLCSAARLARLQRAEDQWSAITAKASANWVGGDQGTN